MLQMFSLILEKRLKCYSYFSSSLTFYDTKTDLPCCRQQNSSRFVGSPRVNRSKRRPRHGKFPKTTKNAHFMIGKPKRLSLFVMGKFYITAELMLDRKLAQPL